MQRIRWNDPSGGFVVSISKGSMTFESQREPRSGWLDHSAVVVRRPRPVVRQARRVVLRSPRVSSLTQSPVEGSVCENIGPRERMKRVRAGIVGLVVLDVVAILLVVEHVARPWRLAIFPLAFGAAVALIQVRERTCVALAARNVRDMDDGEKPVTDEAEQRQIATQVRRVYLHSFLIAAALTGAFLLWPG
jgi:hypothetical protein